MVNELERIFDSSFIWKHEVMAPPMNSAHFIEEGGLGLPKVFKAHYKEELLQEDLAVQHGDVGGPADQGVGGVGQGVDHVIADQAAVRILQNRQEKVLDHLRIHWT